MTPIVGPRFRLCKPDTQRVGYRFFNSKPVKPDLNWSPFRFRPFFQILIIFFLDSTHFFPDFGPFFSRFRSFFHLNSWISGTINTGSSRTSDFSSRFGRNLTGFDGISPDLGWIWQDLAGFGEISPRFEGFRWDQFHPKPTTTRRQPELTNLLLLLVSCGLKNHPPELL